MAARESGDGPRPWLSLLVPMSANLRREWRWILKSAALGACLAGAFGVAHDQWTYAISPEYYTAAKFPQFAWADWGLHPRGFVAVVGFLGSFWVGALGAYAIGRVTLAARAPSTARPQEMLWMLRRILAILALCSLVSAATYLRYAGLRDHPLEGADAALLASWSSWRTQGVRELGAFVLVAKLHQNAYAAALAGVIAAGLQTHLRQRQSPPTALPRCEA